MTNSKTIAIIEDDITLLAIYEMVLSKAGHKVVTAKNGREGLAVIEKYSPDLVLLDLMMPELDGASMLKILRSKDWGARIKVIVLTNVGKSEASSNLDDYNILESIIKVDYTPDQLVDLVNQYV